MHRDSCRADSIRERRAGATRRRFTDLIRWLQAGDGPVLQFQVPSSRFRVRVPVSPPGPTFLVSWFRKEAHALSSPLRVHRVLCLSFVSANPLSADPVFVNGLLIRGSALDATRRPGANGGRLGFFSDIYYDPARNEWWALSDRGPGEAFSLTRPACSDLRSTSTR